MSERRGPILLLAALVAGCAPEAVPRASSRTPTPDDAEAAVIRIAAEILKKPRVAITPGQSLGDLGADELDLVEIVIELEEERGITITDEAIEAAARPSRREAPLKSLTIAKLAAIVRGAARRPDPPRKTGT